MNNARYIKSFSKGQITIPKEVRDLLGIQDEFWLRLWTEEGKIVAEPIEEKADKTEWRKKLLQIPQIAVNQGDIQRNRTQLETQVSKRSL